MACSASVLTKLLVLFFNNTVVTLEAVNKNVQRNETVKKNKKCAMRTSGSSEH